MSGSEKSKSDAEIVDLYWARSESAITATADKYGSYCHAISYRILSDHADADECVNDTYLDAWNSMPPHRPSVLSTFLGKIARRISIDRWRRSHAEKRGGGEIPLALDELSEVVGSPDGGVADALDAQALADGVNAFLRRLPTAERRVFMCRYWHLEPIDIICERFGYSESKVKSMLSRTRAKLRVRLEEEGLL